MDFPEAVRLNKGTMFLGRIPNQRARGGHADADEILQWTAWSIFGLPETCPRSVWFGDPVPPDAGAHGVISVEGIP